MSHHAKFYITMPGTILATHRLGTRPIVQFSVGCAINVASVPFSIFHIQWRYTVVMPLGKALTALAPVQWTW